MKKAKEEIDTVYIENELRKRMVIWFKFFFSRYIIQRYTNVPTGVSVLKLADYSTRMISKIYMDKKNVIITKNKNDGQSNSFEGDGLVNLFLYCWNAFLFVRKERILDKIEYNINTLSDPAKEEDKMVKSINEKMAEEIKEYNKINQ